jgi:peroxiredoxin
MSRVRAILIAAGMAALPALAAGQAPAPASTPNATPVQKPPASKLDELKTADELWAYFQALQSGPPGQGNTKEEKEKALRDFVKDLRAAAERFASKYPADPRRWEARLTAARLLQKIANAIPQAEVEKLYQEAAAAGDAPVDIKTRARLGLIQMHREALKGDSPKEKVLAVDAEIVSFLKDFPNNDQLPMLATQRAALWDRRDPARATDILEEYSKCANAGVAEEAAGQLRFKNIKKEPLPLKFTAIDGRDVDLEKMRGKVVLIYFWSASNGRSVDELSKIAAAYSKFHDQGFEVIGISHNTGKEKFLATVQEKNVPWPQYFDGKGWKNDVSRRYAVRDIPAMWLVNRNGFVAYTDARGELEELLQKLLAE